MADSEHSRIVEKVDQLMEQVSELSNAVAVPLSSTSREQRQHVPEEVQGTDRREGRRSDRHEPGPPRAVQRQLFTEEVQVWHP